MDNRTVPGKIKVWAFYLALFQLALLVRKQNVLVKKKLQLLQGHLGHIEVWFYRLFLHYSHSPREKVSLQLFV